MYFQDQQRLIQFFKICLECSVYLAPTELGLTHQELVEIGSQAGHQQGEIADALRSVGTRQRGSTRLLPSSTDTSMWLSFHYAEDPDFRNPEAFGFVFEEAVNSVRANGIHNAKLERNVLVERGVAAGLPRIDVEAAIAVLILTEQAKESDDVLIFGRGAANLVTPTAQLAQHPAQRPRPNEQRAKAYALVKDVIERRSDGRAKSAEPFEAFAEQLEKLGYGTFRLWWMQIVAELRQASAQTSPVTATVLSAALVEGALTFLVKHARELHIGPMGSKSFEGPTTSWKIDDLITSAAAGKENAILDHNTQLRASALARTRQRIHAGRMLSEYPGGPPDLRPEEARDALLTTELVIRRILDWLQQHPAQHGN